MSPGPDLYSILIHPEESAEQDLEQTNPEKYSKENEFEKKSKKKNKPDFHIHQILLLYQLLFYILEFVLPAGKIFPLQEDFLNCKHL